MAARSKLGSGGHLERALSARRQQLERESLEAADAVRNFEGAVRRRCLCSRPDDMMSGRFFGSRRATAPQSHRFEAALPTSICLRPSISAGPCGNSSVASSGAVAACGSARAGTPGGGATTSPPRPPQRTVRPSRRPASVARIAQARRNGQRPAAAGSAGLRAGCTRHRHVEANGLRAGWIHWRTPVPAGARQCGGGATSVPTTEVARRHTGWTHVAGRWNLAVRPRSDQHRPLPAPGPRGEARCQPRRPSVRPARQRRVFCRSPH